MSQTAGILFDYNGVIVGDEHLQHRAMAEVLSQYGVELHDKLYVDVCLGRTDYAAFQQLKELFERLEGATISKLVSQKVKVYQKLVAKESIIYPGIREIVTGLQKEYALGIVSGALRVEIEPVLREAGLLELFSCMITADVIRRSKPNPEGYLYGIEALKLPAETIVAVEDTPTGIQAAKAAKLKCIAVEHTMPRSQLGRADHVIAQLSELTPELVANVLAGGK